MRGRGCLAVLVAAGTALLWGAPAQADVTPKAFGNCKHRAAKRPAVAARVDPAAPPPAGERREIGTARGSDDSVRIGGTGVRPGESGAPFKSAGFGTDLPTVVLIVLIGLGASMLAGATLGVKRGVSRLRR